MESVARREAAAAPRCAAPAGLPAKQSQRKCALSSLVRAAYIGCTMSWPSREGRECFHSTCIALVWLWVLTGRGMTLARRVSFLGAAECMPLAAETTAANAASRLVANTRAYTLLYAVSRAIPCLERLLADRSSVASCPEPASSRDSWLCGEDQELIVLKAWDLLNPSSFVGLELGSCAATLLRGRAADACAKGSCVCPCAWPSSAVHPQPTDGMGENMPRRYPFA